MVIYAFLTTITTLSSGFIFNLNLYLPMGDVSDNNITNIPSKVSQGKMKMSKTLLTILFSYIIFLGTVTIGQQNFKLLIQYQLADFLTLQKYHYI